MTKNCRHIYDIASPDGKSPWIVVKHPGSMDLGEIVTDDEGYIYEVCAFADDGLPIAHCIGEACKTCKTSTGCDVHKLFTCESCNRLTPYSQGGDCDSLCDMCWCMARVVTENRDSPS